MLIEKRDPSHPESTPGGRNPVRIAVIVGTRGRGSNMSALIAAGRDGSMPATVELVFGTRQDAPAIEAARLAGIATIHFDDTDSEFGSRLVAEFQRRRIDLICLAGYLKLLPSELLLAYPQRVLNIHPALLPKFGGKGMYGHHVHEAVLAAGEQESGCSVHLVTEAYDEGAVIYQLRCRVLAEDTTDSLAARVLALEHIAYPQAVSKLVAGLNVAE